MESDGTSGRAGGFYLAYALGTKHSTPRSQQSRSQQTRSIYNSRSRTQAEDEIEQRPTAAAATHTADARGGTKRHDRSLPQGIEVSTEYGYTSHARAIGD